MQLHALIEQTSEVPGFHLLRLGSGLRRHIIGLLNGRPSLLSSHGGVTLIFLFIHLHHFHSSIFVLDVFHELLLLRVPLDHDSIDLGQRLGLFFFEWVEVVGRKRLCILLLVFERGNWGLLGMLLSLWRYLFLFLIFLADYFQRLVFLDHNIGLPVLLCNIFGHILLLLLQVLSLFSLGVGILAELLDFEIGGDVLVVFLVPLDDVINWGFIDAVVSQGLAHWIHDVVGETLSPLQRGLQVVLLDDFLLFSKRLLLDLFPDLLHVLLLLFPKYTEGLLREHWLLEGILLGRFGLVPRVPQLGDEVSLLLPISVIGLDPLLNLAETFGSGVGVEDEVKQLEHLMSLGLQVFETVLSVARIDVDFLVVEVLEEREQHASKLNDVLQNLLLTEVSLHGDILHGIHVDVKDLLEIVLEAIGVGQLEGVLVELDDVFLV